MGREEDSQLQSGGVNATDSSSSSEDLHRATEKPELTNKHAARYAKVYGFFGFSKAYNFPLWVIFAGGMLGFSLSRLEDLDYDRHFKERFALVPGYWYYFRHSYFRIGMIMHLATVLPAGILMVLQFTPIIRHKAITFHRINGYLVLLLLFLSNLGACLVLSQNQGGGARIAAQTAEGFLVLITMIGGFLAWYNIRRKQIEQHRAWMIRIMFYMGTIITSRILNEIAVPILNRMGDYYGVWSCDEIAFLYSELGAPFPSSDYPQCILPSGAIDVSRRVAVTATLDLNKPEQYGTNIIAPFGTMLWLCIVVHIIGVEIYLRLTTNETERLRKVSYERQVEAGLKHPGSSGLTSDRWGDATWTPPSK